MKDRLQHITTNLETPDRRAFCSYLASSMLGVTVAGLVSGCGKNGKGVAVVDQANIAADGSVSPEAPGLADVPVNRATAKSVIYLYMGGGMTHLDTLDPKENSEVMMNSRAISTNVDGMRLGHWLEKTAKHMDKAAIINSMNTTQGAHGPGNYFMHTSYTKRASITHPTMGSWIGRLSGPMNPDLPASVFVGADSVGGGAGFLPSRFGALGIGDPESGLKNSSRPKGVDEREFERRLELASFLDTEFHDKYALKEVQAYTDAYTDALRLMNSADLKGFSIEDEPKSMHELYGASKFGKGCLLARRLVEHGVRFVEVRSGGWDMHGNIWESLEKKMAELDRGLAALLQDLELRGLLDETLIVLATEFGRSPALSTQGGRNHHPRVFSTMLAGGGIRGGQVYGKSDERGHAVAENKVSVPDFNATIAYAMGLPYNEIVYSPSKRPFTVADTGTPVVDLFG